MKNPAKETPKEKIVNLNEDLSGHGHDKASFNKVMANQEAIKKQIEANKK